jgi:phosphoenolpyruvate carboxylase
MELLDQEYSSLKSDLERAGRYLNRDNLSILARRNSAWREVETDIIAAEQILDIKAAPRTLVEKAHKNLSSNALLFKNNKELPQLIEEMAQLRKSLG